MWANQIKMLKNWEEFQISQETYCVILRDLPSASLFCCGQVLFKTEFIFAVSVRVAYCCRAVTPVTTGSPPSINFILASKYFCASVFLGIRNIILGIPQWKKFGKN
jgi:hypothetical protein